MAKLAKRSIPIKQAEWERVPVFVTKINFVSLRCYRDANDNDILMVEFTRQPQRATCCSLLIKLGFAMVFFGLWFTPSCTYDKGEVILPDVSFCDSTKIADSTIVSYICDVKPILDAQCTLSCHTPTSVQGTPFLDSYDLVSIVADDGRLMCSINWTGGCLTMPFLSGTKIDQEDRNTIQEWINKGKAQ